MSLGKNHIILSTEWVTSRWDEGWQALVIDEHDLRDDIKVRCSDGMIRSLEEYIQRLAIQAVRDNLWV